MCLCTYLATISGDAIPLRMKKRNYRYRPVKDEGKNYRYRPVKDEGKKNYIIRPARG